MAHSLNHLKSKMKCGNKADSAFTFESWNYRTDKREGTCVGRGSKSNMSQPSCPNSCNPLSCTSAGTGSGSGPSIPVTGRKDPLFVTQDIFFIAFVCIWNWFSYTVNLCRLIWLLFFLIFIFYNAEEVMNQLHGFQWLRLSLPQAMCPKI